MTTLILHGIGGHAGIHWQKWLKDQLESQNFGVLMPSLPNANHPDRKIWLEQVQRLTSGINLAELIIVGHSAGVTTALDFIEQAKFKVTGLVSVAGIAKDYGSELNGEFLRAKPIDFNKVLENLNWAEVVYGGNDPYVSQTALRYVAGNLQVNPTIIHNGGHLNTEAGYTQFPRLLKVISRHI